MINIIWSCIIGALFASVVFFAFYGKKCLILTDKTHKDPVIPVKFHKTIEMQYYILPVVIVLTFVIIHFLFHK